MLRNGTLALCLLIPTLCACREAAPEPHFAPSASSPGYATGFPEELAAVRAAYFDQEKAVGAASEALATYPEALDSPDWSVVRSVYEHADREGRSESYATQLERLDIVRRFYESEKDDIRAKVAGAVQYTAKKKKCEGDVGSSAAVALDKALDQQLSEGLHDASDAHTLIGQHEEALGKKNVETLETQADTVALASYLAHVGVVKTKLRLRQMLTEIEDVRGTLDRTLADLDTLAKREDLDDAAKKRLEERRSAAQNAKRRFDTEHSGAKSLSDEIEGRIGEVQKRHQTALEALLKKSERASGPAAGKR